MAFDTFDTDSVATAGITFTNGNLTAQPGAGFSGTLCAVAQTLEGKKNGKWYVEFTLVAVSGIAGGEGVGVVNSWGISANATVNGAYVGGGGNISFLPSQDMGWAYYISGSVDWKGANQAGVNKNTFTAGDVIGVAIDLDNGRIWWRKNTGLWVGTTGTPDPGTNTNGFDISHLTSNGCRVYPAINMSGSSAKFTANFGASAFTGSVPSGFNAGWTNTTAGTYFGTFACAGKGSSSANAPANNSKAVSKYTSTFTGPLGSIIMPFAGSVVKDVNFVAYDDTGVGGLPGALLGVSTNSIASGVYGENTFLFSGPNVILGNSYWFGPNSSRNPLTTENICCVVAQTSGLARNTGSYPTASNPFGAAPTIQNFRYPMLIFPGSVNASRHRVRYY
jgi:hypothetical protein